MEAKDGLSVVVTNALSFDLEEWYHPEAIRESRLRVEKSERVVQATQRILALLRRYAVHATFFTVGEVAAQHPKLIEQLLREGHELAFHGWTHQPLWVLSPESFAAEIEQFLAWRDATFPGVEVRGFRAPTFSIDARTAWGIRVLREHGFVYDSSIFPAKTPLYGVPDAPLTPYRIHEDQLAVPSSAPDALLEVPMSVFALGSVRVGFTGGLYLRAFPWLVVKQLFKRCHQQGRAAVVYIHPWETDAHTPRLALSRWGRFVLYTGLPMLPKLEKLLQAFAFDTMENVFMRSSHEPAD